MNKDVLVIYHLEDNDGVCSAAMMTNYLLTQKAKMSSYNNLFKFNNVKLYGATYKMLNDLYETGESGMNEFFNKYSMVIMLDISFNNPKGMLYLKKKFKNGFVWIDHHAPIINQSFKDGFDDVHGVRSADRSTILNTYKYLYDPLDEMYRNKTVNSVLFYLSAYDSWTHEKHGLPFDVVRAVNTYFTTASKLKVEWWLREFHDGFTFIETLVDNIDNNGDDISEYASIGQQICDKIDADNEQLITQNGDYSWTLGDTNRKICVVVNSGPSNSVMFKTLKGTEYVNGAVLKKTNADDWIISLYNINDDDTFNCGVYLKETYGGGGHKGAAGATLSQETFIKMIKDKRI